MKKRTDLLILICTFCLLLSACGSSAAKTAPVEIIPTMQDHAPDATPFVRVFEKQEQTQSASHGDSGIRPPDDIAEGVFHFSPWCYSMFRGLEPPEDNSQPAYREGYQQDRVYDFTVEPYPRYFETEAAAGFWQRISDTAAELDSIEDDSSPEAAALKEELDELLAEENDFSQEQLRSGCLKAGEAFAAAGCKAKVISCTSTEDGIERTSYLCIVSMCPETLWQLSGSMDDEYYISCTYSGATERFNVLEWES